MRVGRHATLVGAAGAALGAVALAPSAEAQFGGVTCSVLSHHPCAPTVCSPLSRHPCQPQYPFPLGENLQLTIKSADSHEGGKVDPDHKVDTIHDLFVALRACWLPPDPDEAHAGTQMAVRFAFKRTGEIIGEPRVTYTTPGSSIAMPSRRRSIAARRCRSRPAWAARSRAARSRSATSTTAASPTRS